MSFLWITLLFILLWSLYFTGLGIRTALLCGWLLHMAMTVVLSLQLGLNARELTRGSLVWEQLFWWLLLGFLVVLWKTCNGRQWLAWIHFHVRKVLMGNRMKTQPEPLRPGWFDIRKLSDWLPVLPALPTHPAEFLWKQTIKNWEWALLILNPLLWLFLWQLDLNLELAALLPPAAYDVVDYHGPMIAGILQNHTISFTDHFSPYVNFYPKTAQLLYAWQLMWSMDSHQLGTTQIPFLLLGVLSIYSLARSLGSGRLAAQSAGLLFLFFPVVIKQTTTAYVDVTQAAFFLSALALATTVQKKGGLRLALVCGLAIGMLAGIKSTALLYAGMVLVYTVSYYGLDSYGRKPLRYLEPALILLTAVLLGSVWLRQNHTITGNPFYPIAMPELLGGFFETSKEWLAGQMPIDNIYGYRQTLGMDKGSLLWDSIVEVKIGTGGAFRGYDNSTLFGGSGPLVVSVLLPALTAYLLTCSRDSAYPWVLALLIIGAVCLFLQPLSFRLRFIIGLFGLGLVVLALLWSRLPIVYSLASGLVTIALAAWVSYISTLDQATALRGRSFQTPRIINQLYNDRNVNNSQSPAREQAAVLSMYAGGYRNHPNVRIVAEWMSQAGVSNKTIAVSRYYRYPSLYLWGRSFSNRVLYYSGNPPAADILIGYPKDRPQGMQQRLSLGGNLFLYSR
jgi:hypothetical protein